MVQQDEEARLDALHQLNLLDTPPSASFDRITRMASQIFDLPISAVSLTDRDRQWFKSRVGVEHWSIPREKAPCAQVAESRGILIIPDLLDDDCYADSLLAQTGVRFYAGVPLMTREGFGLGSLCVLGTEPRTVSESEMAGLTDLADMTMSQIEMQHAFGRVDPLSGLPNRTQFLDDLEDLGRDAPGQRRYAVLLDLARNDQLSSGLRVVGPSFIDDMVQDAARALRGALGQGRTAYHVAATQFAFLSPPEPEPGAYVALLGSMLSKAQSASRIRFATSQAIGVTPVILGKTDPRQVLRTAYSAAQDARASEHAVGLYAPGEDRVHSRRFALLNDLGAALEEPDQLRLVFQPRIDLASGRCKGAEALLRWRHPTLGDVSPGEFMPIIEHTSLARPTTAWVLDAAMRQQAIWQKEGIDLQLSINVSAANLEESDFAQQVQLYLLKHRLRPAAIELEVTESVVMENSGRAMGQLRALHEAGIPLAIDDFGTGYSSLAYLQRLPARVVKIDQSFVRDLADDERGQALVRSMITLSHDLGYRVVAEGVETAAAAAILADLECEEAQGYYFARPMEEEALRLWLVASPQESSVAA
ncbi:sensor domain-containing phosphodiesterase [Sphingomonas corticis]|uniref:EAL domain-containing protein n=1 Tax=Sphingomonas corticis TaxID=2722791 RepID=A0ABX1CRZ8_9SPHN|nr:sensor domain-containing phosphodiesterase [Sphingomonas corticis]NJR80728.1 EAL domain-containing protein [Sphingomonas corticis]